MIFTPLSEMIDDAQSTTSNEEKKKHQYFQININKVVKNGLSFVVIKFSDITINIQYDLS